jgi:GTP cyclohydrolase III
VTKKFLILNKNPQIIAATDGIETSKMNKLLSSFKDVSPVMIAICALKYILKGEK